MALELRRLELSGPATAAADLLQQIDPAAIQRLRLADDQVAGLPLLLQNEQTCFNRRLMAESPATESMATSWRRWAG
ncbi:MAG: hypothetical protein EA413_07195 [Cyanobium sp. PLM2.Bin73]|jgi:hypothetical protein|nr:MAG: hypothetical protein EA413_07195 [Cyanobium sp. PLM2.Bin73]